MKMLAVACAVAGATALATADYSPNSVWWRAWGVSAVDIGKLDSRYTVLNLFDSNPSTTWVLHRTTGKVDIPSPWRANGFTLDTSAPRMVDGFRIMNGYNKSQRLYDLNDAVSEVRVYAGEKLLKTVRLSNRLGWHRVSLPPTRIGETDVNVATDLTFEITGVRKGKVHDLCISGLQLLDKGKVLPWRLDSAVLFNPGGETEPGDTELWSLDGKRMVTDRGNSLAGPMINPNGRYIMGTDCPQHSISLWVADRNTGAVIYRKRMFSEPNPAYPHIYYDSATWSGNRVADIRFEVCDQPGSGVWRYVTRRIRF
ncbi:MAG: NADase-type glycan-binding domain-containing protein [Fimbriimonadales bacterium]